MEIGGLNKMVPSPTAVFARVSYQATMPYTLRLARPPPPQKKWERWAPCTTSMLKALFAPGALPYLVDVFFYLKVPGALAKARCWGDYDHGRMDAKVCQDAPGIPKRLCGHGRDRVRPRRRVPGDRPGE